MTSEHLWPDWMAQFLPRLPDAEHVEIKMKFDAKARHPAEPEFKRTRQGAPNTKRLKLVCRKCNGGWMSRLESAVKPFLSKMIKAETVVLNEGDRRTFAEWVAMKVLVLDQNEHMSAPIDPVFQEQDRREFYASRRIPAFFNIMIATRGGPKWTTQVWRHASALTTNKVTTYDGKIRNTQTVTWGMGHVLIYVVATKERDVVPFLMKMEDMYVPPDRTIIPLVQFWPTAEHDIKWPLSLWASDVFADRLAESLQRLIRSNIVRRPGEPGPYASSHLG